MADDVEEQMIQLNEQQSQLYQEGKYEQAINIAKQACTLAQQHLEPNHRYTADSLNNLAVLYMEVGKYSEAESIYLDALEIYRRILTKDDSYIATILSNLAYLYELAGDYIKAEPLLLEVLQVTQTALGKHNPDYAFSLNNLALFYYRRLGRYEAAEPLFRQAVRIYRGLGTKKDSDFAYTLNNLAGLYESMGQYVVALPLYKQSLQILGEIKGEDHPAYAIGLNNLAYLYASMGRYTAAERLYQRALKIRQTVWGDSHPDIADSLNNLAEVYTAMGKYTKAEPLARQAFAMRQMVLGKMHPDVAQSLQNLAGLYAAMDRIPEALSLMNEAAVINNWMIGQAFSIGSEQQRMDYLAMLQGNFAGFLSLVCQYQADVLPAVQMTLDLVLRRKAIGAEALAIQRDTILGGRYPSLAPKLRELKTLRTQIAQKTLAGPALETLEMHNQQLDEWNARKEQLEAELARLIPEMNLEQKLRTANRHTVCKGLLEDSVLVEFIRIPIFNFKAVLSLHEFRWQPAHYLAFVLLSGEPDNVQMVDLGEADVIDQRVAAFRIAITGEPEVDAKTKLDSLPGLNNQALLPADSKKAIKRHASPASSQSDKKAYLREGNVLRAAIFDPLIAALGGRTRLFLAPDGNLARLPFEVLPTNDCSHLIDDYHISYLGVGRDVLRFGAASTDQPTIPLVIADPDFNLGSETPAGSVDRIKASTSGRRSRDLRRGAFYFGQLEGTRVEGMQIAAQLEVPPLLEKSAVEVSIKIHRSPRILHLATHGFFLPDQQSPEMGISGREDRLSQRLENPLLRSGLALAGVNTWLQGGTPPPEAEDGLLTAEDVSGLDLLATELVVLSACETGLGQIQVGEGVFGLQRAFVLAGAKTLIMSLWKVPDQQTQELMEEFYQHILSGQPCASALRRAQLAIKARYPQPYSWGAFICQGNPGPLS